MPNNNFINNCYPSQYLVYTSFNRLNKKQKKIQPSALFVRQQPQHYFIEKMMKYDNDDERTKNVKEKQLQTYDHQKKQFFSFESNLNYSSCYSHQNKNNDLRQLVGTLFPYITTTATITTTTNTNTTTSGYSTAGDDSESSVAASQIVVNNNNNNNNNLYDISISDTASSLVKQPKNSFLHDETSSIESNQSINVKQQQKQFTSSPEKSIECQPQYQHKSHHQSGIQTLFSKLKNFITRKTKKKVSCSKTPLKTSLKQTMNNEHEYFMENYSSTSYQQTSILSSNKHYQHREEKNIYQSTTLPFTYELEQEHNDIEQATKIQKNVNPYFDRIAAWLENTQILNEDIADLPFIDDNNNDLTLADNFIQQQQTTNNKGFYQTSILNNNHLSDIFGSILPHDYSNITSSKQLDQTNRYGNEIKMKQSSLSSPSIRTDKPKRSSSMITTTHQHQPKQTTSTAIVQTLTPTSSFSSIILTTGMNDHDLLTTPVKKLSTEINRRKTIATVKDYSQQQNNHRHSRIDDNNRIAKSQQQQRGLSINNQENFSTPTIVRRRRIIDFSRRRTVATTSSSTTDINNNNKENLNDNKKQSSLIRKDSLTKPTIIKQHGPTNNVSFSTSTSTSSFPKSDKKQPVIELIQPPSIYKFTSSPLTQLSKKYYFNNNNATTSSDNESMVDDESMSFYGLLQNSDYSKNGPKNRNSLVMVSWQAPQQQQHSLPMSTYNTNNNNDIPPSKNLINFQMISEYNNRSNKSHSCSISSPSYQSEQLSNNDLIDDLLCDREVESYFYPNSVYSSYADYSYEPHQQYPHIYINVPPHQQIAKSTKQNMPSAIINLPDYYGTLC